MGNRYDNASVVENARAEGLTHSVAHLLPEALQEPMRRRLKLIRQARGVVLNQLKSPSGSTVTTMENTDLSRAKLGTLYQLTEAMGEDFCEFMTYLVGSGSDPTQSSASTNVVRMHALMRSLNNEDQEMVLDIIRLVVTSRNPRRAGGEHRAVSTRTAREILTAHCDDTS